MKKVCVLGGGIAGLFAARVLVEKGHQVTLLESAPDVGGLLKSFEGPCGQDFDYGTHIMRETGVKEIDRLLFSSLSEDWRSFEILRTGSVANGKLYSRSAFIDANSLDQNKRELANTQFLGQPASEGPWLSAADYLESAFGSIYAKELFEPALNKLFDVPPENLHRNALRQFGLTRMVALSSEKTNQLKEDPWYDERLAYHDYNQGSSGLLNHYPRRGGIGLFIEGLKKDLLSRGVQLHCQQKITSVQMEAHAVKEIETQEGRHSFDHLVWTLPIPFLNHLCGRPSQGVELKFRDVGLYYFVFQRPLQTELYYIMNFDPAFKAFRTTFYQNLKQVDEAFFSCCVEVLGHQEELKALKAEEVQEELRRLGLLGAEQRAVEEVTKSISKGFPVMTTEFAASSALNYEAACDFYSNVSFAGRSSGRVFFTNDILMDTFELMHHI